MQKIRVLIADDEPAVRSALRLHLELRPDTTVVGEVTDAEELSRWLEKGCADMVVIDWELPGARTIDLPAMLHNLCPGAAVIALSVLPQARRAAAAAGADDFVSKGDPPERLLAAVDCCRRNKMTTSCDCSAN